jgi:hypothetical protein
MPPLSTSGRAGVAARPRSETRDEKSLRSGMGFLVAFLQALRRQVGVNLRRREAAVA